MPSRAERCPDAALAPGGRGPLVGGCLSLLAALAGTPDAPAADGSVLFWEDVGEEPYRLDRMLTQLQRSGTFKRLQGMVIGSIAPRDGDHAGPAPAVREWLARTFSGAPFPVVAASPGTSRIRGRFPGRPRAPPRRARPPSIPRGWAERREGVFKSALGVSTP